MNAMRTYVAPSGPSNSETGYYAAMCALEHTAEMPRSGSRNKLTSFLHAARRLNGHGPKKDGLHRKPNRAVLAWTFTGPPDEPQTAPRPSGARSPRTKNVSACAPP